MATVNVGERMPDRMRAKVDSVCAAHHEWQRGTINEAEYLRRADITDEQHRAIEAGLSRYSDRETVLIRVANVLFPR